MSEKKSGRDVVYMSPNQKALKRLLKNKAAILGLVIICLAVLIAIFAYAIVPDSSPNANEQILEIATERPGFTIDMLKVRKNRGVNEVGFFGKLIGGRENVHELVPINAHSFEGENVIVNRYTGPESEGKMDTFNLADIVFPLSVEDPSISRVGEQLEFKALGNEKNLVSISDLRQQVEQNNIKSQTYLLGTDKFGRDNLSRLILGVRVSLSVGLVAVLISLLIGITLGALAGYYRGWVDEVIMWIINVFWSIPLLLWVFALVLALGREFWQIFLAVGLVMWVEVARIVRGQFFSIREKEFVEAAQSMGFSDMRTIFKHILPNIVGPIIVITAANFASAIIIEAGLSFLGIGVQPPKPSWGTTLNEYYKYIGSEKSFLAILPGLAILILTLGFNLVGNGIRDALDVRSKA